MTDELSVLIDIVKTMTLPELVWFASLIDSLSSERSEEGCE